MYEHEEEKCETSFSTYKSRDLMFEIVSLNKQKHFIYESGQ